jgi:uncharacterized LabA/DUF88 family protein
MSGDQSRVAVFIDWQNAYRAARRAFGLQNLPNEHGNFSPYQLARILAAGNGRGANAALVRVQVHRGLPHSSRDSIGYAANRRQATAWVKEAPQIVVPCHRPLRYPYSSADPPVEKGIDVELALGAVEQLATGRCDVAIIFSHDTDLNPAVETIMRLKGPRAVETAAWSSPSHRSRLRQRPGVHHHEISKNVFRRVETLVNYAHGS